MLIMASKCLLIILTFMGLAQGFSMLDFDTRDPPSKADAGLFDESDPCYDAKLKKGLKIACRTLSTRLMA